MNLNQIDSSQHSNNGNDSTPTGLNKTDAQWSNTSQIQSSM